LAGGAAKLGAGIGGTQNAGSLISSGVRVAGFWSALRPVMRPSDMPPPCSCT
jgi:hypothetical protein